MRAGEDDDVLRPDLRAATLEMVAGDCRAQRGAARNVGIVGVAGTQRCDGRVDDRGGRRKIRVAERQHDHVLAGAFGLHGRGVDVPGGGALAGEAVDAGGIAHGGTFVREVRNLRNCNGLTIFCPRKRR